VSTRTCLQCGKTIHQQPTGRVRQYCSDTCRNEHNRLAALDEERRELSARIDLEREPPANDDGCLVCHAPVGTGATGQVHGGECARQWDAEDEAYFTAASRSPGRPPRPRRGSCTCAHCESYREAA
jgi:hypothetical protein